MLKFFYKLFNHDKIEKLEHSLEIYRTRNKQLEKELREYKGYKLKYKVAQMLVDDDPAIEELLDCYKETQRQKNTTNISSTLGSGIYAAGLGGSGGLGGLGGLWPR